MRNEESINDGMRCQRAVPSPDVPDGWIGSGLSGKKKVEISKKTVLCTESNSIKVIQVYSFGDSYPTSKLSLNNLNLNPA